jgi:prolyl oligopeptidase
MRRLLCRLAIVAWMVAAGAHAQPNDDPHLWLEEVTGEAALAWVRQRNALARKQLEAHPRFHPMRDRFLEILNSRDRIPQVVRLGPWLYNFWRDEQHTRGVWRRTTLAEYRRREPRWETVLDLDALAARESESWVWAEATCHGPRYRRCLLALSRGGGDATVVREFDTVDKAFVEGGFALPEAKSELEWVDADTVYVGTDFGPGSLTASGYPRLIKRWRRGQPLAEAAAVFEGDAKDVGVGVTVEHSSGSPRTVFSRWLDFYNSSQFVLERDRLREVDKPADASATLWHSQLLLELRSDLTRHGVTYPRGSLVALPLFGSGRLQPLFTPSAQRSLAGFTLTRDHVIVNVLDNVASRLEERRFDGRSWHSRQVAAPFPGTLGVAALHDPQLPDDPLAQHYLVTYSDFLTPDSLSLARAGSDSRRALKARPAFFDASGMTVEQSFATSRDGTRVPYFVVWPAGARSNGANPTLLYGYGGFEVPVQPWYSAGFGSAWMSRGGVLVVANIRGGGEFGPAWHQAATRQNKQKSFDDFIAVAEDLIARRITSPRHLGMQGGSNGGLLVAAVMLQRPELFHAVVCQAPLLDMKRYDKLLAGASWIAEYGDPDDAADWAALARYSPYQNVKPDMRLPAVLFTTSTRDDRVHPGHARKMAARMLEQGHELLYYENIEGGHGLAADNVQRADLMALEFAFLWQQLGRSVEDQPLPRTGDPAR